MFGEYSKAIKLLSIPIRISLEASIIDSRGDSARGDSDADDTNATSGHSYNSNSPIEDECWEIWTGHVTSGECVVHI